MVRHTHLETIAPAGTTYQKQSEKDSYGIGQVYILLLILLHNILTTNFYKTHTSEKNYREE